MATRPLPTPGRAATRGGEALARHPAFAVLARAGLAARGGVYGVVAVLAFRLALGAGGHADSQQGALKTIAHEPFGKVLLIAVAIGLGGYALWRLTRAAIGHGTRDADGTAERVAGAASGIAYAVLCVSAVKILAGAGTQSGSGSARRATAGILGWPGGPVIVVTAGVVLIVVAGYQGYKGVSRSFLEDSDTAAMSPATERAFTALGVVGHLARMVVFALIGVGLITAAVDYRPRSAIGLDGALSTLAHSSGGPVLLGVVAAGLIGFAAYSVADARYRKV